jgi:hypothetical protein
MTFRPSVLLRACLLLAIVPLVGCTGAPPKDLKCTSDANGNHLTWSPLPNATAYNVYRQLNTTNGSLPEQIATTESTSYTDINVTKGQAYIYYVTGFNTTAETQPAACEVVSVPVFATPLAVGLAVVGAGAAVGFVLWRRR